MDPFADIASSAAITLISVFVVIAAVRLWKVGVRPSAAVTGDRSAHVHRRARREAFGLAVVASLGLVAVLWLL